MFGISRRRALAAAIVAAPLLLALGAIAQAAQPVTAADMTLGNPKAKVTVIEYASLSCSHCARFNETVFPSFKTKYVDTGKVFYVYREFLTDPIQVAGAAAVIARCAPKARYFTVIDTFFRGQAAMLANNDAGPLLVAAGKAGGLSEDQVSACLDDKAAVAALNARIKSYITIDKIKFTPTVIVNGKTVEGEVTLEALSAAIDPLLKTPAARRR